MRRCSVKRKRLRCLHMWAMLRYCYMEDVGMLQHTIMRAVKALYMGANATAEVSCFNFVHLRTEAYSKSEESSHKIILPKRSTAQACCGTQSPLP